MSAISAGMMQYEQKSEANVRKSKTEEEYFNEDDETDYRISSSSSREKKKRVEDEDLPYQPAPGSPTQEKRRKTQESDDDDSEEDALDAFMANLEADAKKGMKKPVESKSVPEKETSKKGVRTDIEEADNEESYYKWLEDNPNAGRSLDEDEFDVEYDEEGNPIAPPKSKYIDPLPSIDHAQIDYAHYERSFYVPHPDISGLSPIQVIDLQQKLGIRVSGASPPKPVSSFAHFGFDEHLMKAIRKSEFSQPTPIQSQAIPALLSGRDVIGIAKTGSGKTAAFLWPMLVHIMDQPRLLKGQGPIGLILVPTRELALQIYSEAKKFGKVYNLQVVCAYGGGSKWEQSKAFEAGAEIAIATPGRMIDMIKMKVTNLQRVTYLVLDEADRMFDMGFEPQVRSICDHVRPDRQCMLFSATFKKKIERLARDSLTDPVKIVQGSIGEASEDVTQIVRVLGMGGFKWTWLLSKLVEFTSSGSVLIFVTKKSNCEELAANLKVKDFHLRLIHGDLLQHERNEIITSFRKQEFPVLVATDVAARGLDIPHIRTVVNFDMARDIDTHTHRVGRTGRAGIKGTAYTLVTEKDKEMAGHLVRHLEQANQMVPKELMDLAMKSSWFRSSRFKKSQKQKSGLGFSQDKPGFGTASAPKSDNEALDDYLMSTEPKPRNQSSQGVIGGSGRLSAVKSAFKSQFMSNFCKSQDSMANATNTISATALESFAMPPPPPPPPGEEGEEPSTSTTSDAGETRRKRKSRWE